MAIKLARRAPDKTASPTTMRKRSRTTPPMPAHDQEDERILRAALEGKSVPRHHWVEQAQMFRRLKDAGHTGRELKQAFGIPESEVSRRVKAVKGLTERTLNIAKRHPEPSVFTHLAGAPRALEREIASAFAAWLDKRGPPVTVADVMRRRREISATHRLRGGDRVEGKNKATLTSATIHLGPNVKVTVLKGKIEVWLKVEHASANFDTFNMLDAIRDEFTRALASGGSKCASIEELNAELTRARRALR